MHAPNKFRVETGELASDPSFGNNGYFVIQKEKHRNTLACVASDGVGWEHVSVSTPYRCPTWEEMCEVKDLFWDAEDLIVQYHPPKSEYVNNHPFVLHLWRQTDKEFPLPPSILVGFKDKNI